MTQTMKKRVLLVILIVVAVAIGLSTTANIALADSHFKSYPAGFQIIPEECLNPGTTTKVCDLTSFVRLFINLAQVMLKILPYIAMIMMIWAGFNLITSGGNPEKVQGGKKMVTSIVLGVLIVTVLAWTWSFFIVTALTCNLGDQENTCKGKIFPNTPLSKEWWGGGDPVADLPPEGGCCVIVNYGCTEVTKEECTDLGNKSGTIATFQERKLCKGLNQCETLKEGCCVTKQIGDDICYWPNEQGCIDAPVPTTWNKNDCGNITGDPNFCIDKTQL